LQDEDKSVRAAETETLRSIGTPEALKAVKEYQSDNNMLTAVHTPGNIQVSVVSFEKIVN